METPVFWVKLGKANVNYSLYKEILRFDHGQDYPRNAE
jgi:hypothetical protein